MAVKQESSMTTLKKVWQVIDAYRHLLLESIVLAGLSVALQLYVPVLFGRAIDGILGPGKVDFAQAGRTTSLIILLVVLSALATWAMNRINNLLAYRTVRDIRSRAIRQVQQLPLSYLDSHSSGDLVQRMIADGADPAEFCGGPVHRPPLLPAVPGSDRHPGPADRPHQRNGGRREGGEGLPAREKSLRRLQGAE